MQLPAGLNTNEILENLASLPFAIFSNSYYIYYVGMCHNQLVARNLKLLNLGTQADGWTDGLSIHGSHSFSVH